MIVDDFCLKKTTTFRNCFLIAIVRIFICVGTMAIEFHNQTTLFHRETVSHLLLFHLNGASERNVIPATARKASSYVQHLDVPV